MIDNSKIRAAEKCLIDNGIEPCITGNRIYSS